MNSKIDNMHSVTVLMLDRHLGNLVVSLSSIVALVEYFQGEKCYLAMDSAYMEVVESITGLDKIIHYPRRNIATLQVNETI